MSINILMAPKMGEAEHLRSLVRILFFLLSFLSGVHEVLTSWWGIVASSSTGTINNSAGNQSHAEPPPRPDFGDSANPLWSLFSKQAKTQDEARIQSLAGDMEGIRENLNDYCCHVMQKVRRYTEYSMTWHLSRANMKFDENLVIFMQL